MNIEQIPSNESPTGPSTVSPIRRTIKLIGDTTSDCFDCMLDFWLNVWNQTCIFCLDAWEWTNQQVCSCANRQANHRSRSRFITNRTANLKDVNNNDRILSGGSPVPEYAQTKGGQLQPQSNKLVSQPIAATPSPDLTVRSNLNTSGTGSLENANKLGSPSSVTDAKQPQQQSTPPANNQPKQPLTDSPETNTSNKILIKAQPPKIEFVETGSIFGDRKRQTVDHNMLLVENGRFRSPGMPKIVRGPGGRPIRVTFVSGFPSIKSIESRTSLTAYNSKTSRKSIDSLPLPLAQTTVKSSDSRKQPTNPSITTIKSNKSVNSQETDKNSE